jgi:hypothetical protein
VFVVGAAPAQPGAFQEAARRLGILIGPTIGTLVVFLIARRVARGSTHPHRDGTLAGAVAASFVVPLMLGAEAAGRIAYLGSMALKLAGGWAGGAVASRRKAATV